jgi:outer membrane receptor protein involved in Fe transport
MDSSEWDRASPKIMFNQKGYDMNIRKDHLVLSLAASMLSIIAAQASAQERSALPDGDIVVTANKRAENVQEVAASVVALSGESLVKQGVFNAKDLARAIPNLNVLSVYGEGGSPNFVMRGVTANDYSLNQSRPVAMYVDEGVRGLPALEIVQFFDIERTEVLRGPQGTLYGKNATGGAINIVTKKAGFDTEGYLTLGYGNFNRKDARGAVQTALVDGVLAARLAFTYTKDDGLIENVLPGHSNREQTNVYAVRASFTFTPSPDFEANLRLFHAQSKGAGIGPLAQDIRPYLGVSRNGLSYYQIRSDFDTERDIQDTGVNLAMRYNISPTSTLTSITTYDHGKWMDPADADGVEVSTDHILIASDDVSQFTQELRYAYDSGPVNFMIGGMYTWDSALIINDYRFLNQPSIGVTFNPNSFGVPYTGETLYGFNERNSFRQKRNSYAAFVRGEYELTPAIKASAGVRYSKDDIEASEYNAALGGTTASGTIVYNVPTLTNASTKASFERVTFEAGVDWKLADEVMAYASFHQGYRSGAINALAFLSASEVGTVRPETVNSYEVGLKTQLLDRRITFNLAAFRSDYRNQQFQNNEGALIVLRNADKSRIWGVEFDSRFKLSSDVSFSVSGGWLDPKYLSLDLSPNDPTTGDYSGNQLIGANKWSLNLGGDVTFARFDKGSAYLHLDASYKSSTYFDAPNSDDMYQKGYWVANGRVSADVGNVNVAFWMRNIFEQHYFVSIFKYADAVGVDEAHRGAPRTFGVEGTFRF